ncbi:MAG TPA: RNHCP domain-containing protein [Anaerolineaceae bacterium]
MKYRFDQVTSDFKCRHCHQYVSTDPLLSGVNNRNHCPYCLWSRHMDLYQPGDRLSACKTEMRPLGVTLKQTRKKYGVQQGELMLVHRCVDCGSFSINRIAADDDAGAIYAIYLDSLTLDAPTLAHAAAAGIQMLRAADAAVARARLFGIHAREALVSSFA